MFIITAGGGGLGNISFRVYTRLPLGAGPRARSFLALASNLRPEASYVTGRVLLLAVASHLFFSPPPAAAETARRRGDLQKTGRAGLRLAIAAPGARARNSPRFLRDPRYAAKINFSVFSGASRKFTIPLDFMGARPKVPACELIKRRIRWERLSLSGSSLAVGIMP